MALFWIWISYDNRVSFRVSGSRLPNWLMCNLQFHDLSLNIVQNKTLWVHVDMSGEMGHSTWSCLGILCWDPPNIYLCCVWSQIKKSATGRTCFGQDMAAHCVRQWAHQFHFWHDWYITFAFWHCKYLPISIIGIFQKKRHKNIQHSQRYCHLLLVTVDNSEQDMLHSDRNHWHFLHSNMVGTCTYI